MKILLLSKINSKTMGSERVFFSTKKALEKIGVKVELRGLEAGEKLSKQDLDGIDVVHWFNHGGQKGFWKEPLSIAKRAKKPIVATATYWPLTEGEVHSGIKFLELNPIMVQRLIETRLYQDRELASILNMADVIIATSNGELKQIHGLMSFWNQKIKRAVIIPNVIDTDEIRPFLKEWESRSMQIIQVGRIEVAKNQIRVLTAFRRLRARMPDISLILVGRREESLIERYEKLFFQDGVSMLGEIEPSLVVSLMQESRVHVLPSFRDTPGLASLEAAACGCNIVVSKDFGTPSEYFGDFAIYANPLDDLSIELAMERGLTVPPSPRLQQLILERFTYDRVANMLVALYNMVVTRTWKTRRIKWQ